MDHLVNCYEENLHKLSEVRNGATCLAASLLYARRISEVNDPTETRPVFYYNSLETIPRTDRVKTE